MAAEDLMLVGVRGEEMEPDEWLWPDPAPKVWQHLSLSMREAYLASYCIQLIGLVVE